MPASALPIHPFTGARLPELVAAGGATTAARRGMSAACGTLAGAVVVSTPAAPSEGAVFAVEDVDGAANINAITVAGTGALLDGASSVVVARAGAYVPFVYDRGQWRRLVALRALDGASAPLQFSADEAAGTDLSDRAAILTADAAPVSVPLVTLALGEVRQVDVIVRIASADAAVRQCFKLSAIVYGAAGPAATLDAAVVSLASGTGTALAELVVAGASLNLRITGIAATDLVTRYDASVI